MNKTPFQVIFMVFFVGSLFMSGRRPTDEVIMDKPVEEPYVNPEATAYEFPSLPFFPPMDIPTTSPLTNEGVELGRYLFWDESLSGNNTQSCADCHFKEAAFSDPNQFSVGITGAIGSRQAMACVNLGWGHQFFWDGRAHSLEEQVVGPVENPIEMNENWDDLVVELAAIDIYPPMYQAAFGTPTITKQRTAVALASFLRVLVSHNSKFDRQRIGQYMYTESEQRGYNLYLTEPGDSNVDVDPVAGADCFHCHPLGAMQLTDQTQHNNGLDSIFTDLGIGGVTGLEEDMGMFKVPTLRNIELTAPYMHDGRFTTLEEVVDHYNSGGHPSATVDALMRYNTGGLHMDAQDKADLINFLKCFTDTTFIHNEAYANPFE